MSDPQRVYVEGGTVSVDLGVGWLLVAGVWAIAFAVGGMKKDIAAALDRNTAAMTCEPVAPAESKSWPEVAAEPLKPPSVILENE